MTTTIGELISQIRNQSKAVNQDERYLSDRLIFSLIRKHSALFLYREDANMKLTKLRFLYITLPFVELIEVDKVEAACRGIKSDCTIKRTKNKLPKLLQGYRMPLIGEVTSLDGDEHFVLTTPLQYVNKINSSDSKYNKTKYYWILDDYAYFPNTLWDAVKMEVIPDAQSFTECGEPDPCKKAQDMEFGMPNYLMNPVQAEVLKDIAFLFQVPDDPVTDKQSAT